MNKPHDHGEPAVREVEVWRRDADGASHETDRVAVEAPLEVRLNGQAFSVIMRTPGEDRTLATGFLFSEGILRSAGDVEGIAEVTSSVIDVTVSARRTAFAAGAIEGRRQVALNSSCGLCGRRTIESLTIEAPALMPDWVIGRQLASSLPAALRAAQTAFASTGGLHAAGLFDLEGALLECAEDVGRHNAVDKLVGRALLAERLPLTRSLLCVSGRTSYEIVQKAHLAGIPLVAAVSAPSSLAVDLARGAGITLLGFVRDRRYNVYTHAGRIGDIRT